MAWPPTYRRALWILAVVAALTLSRPAASQVAMQSPRPVIDMHVHSTTTQPADLVRMQALNVRYVFLSALAADLKVWSVADPTRYLPAIVLPCDRRRAPVGGRQCFDNGAEFPDVTWLRSEIEAGRIKALGEMAPEYFGVSPNDPRLEPYWQIAEQFDLPVGIHLGPGPRDAAYPSSVAPFKSPSFRMAAGDPMLLEDVLLRHKKLRVSVMHAGWPRLESMIALLYAHPGVYVDVAALQSKDLVPRTAYYGYLRGLVEAGFESRIMFGSDFPNRQKEGIDAIEAAGFLTDAAKSDILCNNAARFLRLGASVCAR